MTYDLSPQVTRLTPFNSANGGALAAVDVNFGPIMIRAKLFHNDKGYYLMWPARKSEATEKWYDYTAIADPSLRMKALDLSIRHYKTMSEGVLVAV